MPYQRPFPTAISPMNRMTPSLLMIEWPVVTSTREPMAKSWFSLVVVDLRIGCEGREYFSSKVLSSVSDGRSSRSMICLISKVLLMIGSMCSFSMNDRREGKLGVESWDSMGLGNVSGVRNAFFFGLDFFREVRSGALVDFCRVCCLTEFSVNSTSWNSNRSRKVRLVLAYLSKFVEEKNSVDFRSILKVFFDGIVGISFIFDGKIDSWNMGNNFINNTCAFECFLREKKRVFFLFWSEYCALSLT